jgi:polar amino acid transport system substrate-binding protein
MKTGTICMDKLDGRDTHSPLKLFALIVLIALTLLTACSPHADQKASPTQSPGDLGAVVKSGVLVIATDADYAPQSQLKKDEPRAANTRCDMTQYTANQFAGFDIDVAVEIARRLGVEPCFVTPTWSQIVAGNWGDRWDISVGSMVITPERMQNLYFTQPYASGEAALFVYKDNQTFKQPADLSGKKVGVCAGCAYESYLKGNLVIPGEKIDYVIKNATVFGYDTDTSALADLAAGDGARLDGVIADPATGKVAIQDGMPIKRLGGPLYLDYDAAAVDKQSSNDSIPLVRKVTEIIQEMHRDGTLLKLSLSYYSADTTTAAAQFDVHALNQFPQP